MKLILQIAIGIVLAAIIIFIGSSTVTYFAAKSLSETIKNERVKQEKIKQLRIQASEIKRIKKEEMKRLERQRIEIKNRQFIESRNKRNRELDKKIRAEAIKKAKIRKAWNLFYEKPYQCNQPDSENIIIWCNNHKMNEKTRFNKLVKEGKINLKG